MAERVTRGYTMPNGHTPQDETKREEHVFRATMDTPVIQVNPFAISLAQMRWFVLGTIGAIWSLYSAEYLYRPAKATDLESLTKVVQTLDVAQKDSRMAIDRLVTAVEKLNDMVSRLPSQKNAVKGLRLR